MTNPFYSSEQTEQSKAVLDDLLATVPDAILIGGWGTWARVGGAMSHDVDLIVTRGELAQIEVLVDELSESRHLAGTKWRGTWQGVHIDLYAPYQSRLGANLQLRVEALGCRRRGRRGPAAAERASPCRHQGRGPVGSSRQPSRPQGPPGAAQLACPAGVFRTPGVIGAASARTPSQVGELIDQAFVFLAGQSNLTRQDRARLRQMAQQWHRTALDPRGTSRQTALPTEASTCEEAAVDRSRASSAY